MNEAEKNQPVRRVGRYAGKTQKLDSMIEQIQDEKAKDYIVSRIIPSMNYYSQKSRQYKNQYLWLMSMSIILGAMVPVCVLFTDSTTPIKVLLVFLSAGVLAVNMLLSVNSYKDLWLLYRNNRETLERTLYYYVNDVDVFRNGDQAEKGRVLIETCEKEMAVENGTWRAMMER